MIIDENELELFFEQFYKEALQNNDKEIVVNHQLFDQYFSDVVDELQNKYTETKNNIERIINGRRISSNSTRIKFRNVRPVVPLRELHKKYNGKFVCFEGMVKNRSMVKEQVVEAHWECGRCSLHEHVRPMKHGERVTPRKMICPRCNSSTQHHINKKTSKYKDVQLVVIQEPLGNVAGGFQPAETKVYFENDMVDKVKPGDIVKINGVLELHNKGTENVFTEYVTAEHVEHLQQDFEDIVISPEEVQEIKELSQKDNFFDVLTQSCLPSLYGNPELKEAIVLHLFSSDSTLADDVHDFERGDIHVLLIGDPGVAKSQILKRVSNLAPRCVYTSGKSSSGAGLTATVVKDEFGSWSLEAGAMVLADKGNICIDEFDKMREEDRSTIHEALEQQTISISKAGITTTLNSRCSVLAAANPKFGTFNPHKSIKEQISLSSPILSRFDFIFVIRDTPDKDNDANIAMSILMKDFDNEEMISFELLRKYISYARKNVHPVLPLEVAKRLTEFYTNWRESAVINNNPIPITARQLSAVGRLAKASARARLSDTVTLEDAERAISLQEYCMARSGFDVEADAPNATMMMGESNGVKDDMNESRIISLTEDLCEEWDNKVPIKVFEDTLKKKGLRKDTIGAWLKSLDDDGSYYYDPVEGYLNKL